MLMKRRRNESQARDMRRLARLDGAVQADKSKRNVMSKSQFRKKLMKDLEGKA